MFAVGDTGFWLQRKGKHHLVAFVSLLSSKKLLWFNPLLIYLHCILYKLYFLSVYPLMLSVCSSLWFWQGGGVLFVRSWFLHLDFFSYWICKKTLHKDHVKKSHQNSEDTFFREGHRSFQKAPPRDSVGENHHLPWTENCWLHRSRFSVLGTTSLSPVDSALGKDKRGKAKKEYIINLVIMYHIFCLVPQPLMCFYVV